MKNKKTLGPESTFADKKGKFWSGKCPDCGYLKAPEQIGDFFGCVGCDGLTCSVCNQALPRPGEAKIPKDKDGIGVVVYRREGDKIVCGECLKKM